MVLLLSIHLSLSFSTISTREGGSFSAVLSSPALLKYCILQLAALFSWTPTSQVTLCDSPSGAWGIDSIQLSALIYPFHPFLGFQFPQVCNPTFIWILPSKELGWHFKDLKLNATTLSMKKLCPTLVAHRLPMCNTGSLWAADFGCCFLHRQCKKHLRKVWHPWKTEKIWISRFLIAGIFISFHNDLQIYYVLKTTGDQISNTPSNWCLTSHWILSSSHTTG